MNLFHNHRKPFVLRQKFSSHLEAKTDAMQHRVSGLLHHSYITVLINV